MTRGIDRVLDVLKERKLRATCFVPGWVAENYPEKVRQIEKQGHEIGAMGYKHENMALLSSEEQEAAIRKGNSGYRKGMRRHPEGFQKSGRGADPGYTAHSQKMRTGLFQQSLRR